MRIHKHSNLFSMDLVKEHFPIVGDHCYVIFVALIVATKVRPSIVDLAAKIIW